MTTWELFIARAALAAALVGSPWWFARLAAPRAGWIPTGAIAGIFAIALNIVVPLILHVSRIPIQPFTLAAPHLLIFILLTAALIFRRTSLRPPTFDLRSPTAALLAGFALLVLPITHLAGIDTYKWQGLATAVRMETCIPWLIHPISLLGFTPRAYPPADPLLLASIQILGGVGVEIGFYLASLISGFTGICLAHTLARRYFDVPQNANWFAFFYAFSPVFMRYNHWATGRGLFLALLPLLLLNLLALPRPRAFLCLPFTCLLLALTHKVGLVACAVILPAVAASFLLPRVSNRWLPLLLAAPFVAIAVLLSPPLALSGLAGHTLGFLRTGVTRFGWMIPVAALGLVGPRGWLLHPSRRRLFLPMLATLPLAFPPDIYGALLALPFVTLAATAGLSWLHDTLPRHRRLLAVLIVSATLCGALAIVTQRTLGATPPRVWRAAQFLNQIDPRGPYDVTAPGRARAQIHGNVSGCPRFDVAPGEHNGIAIRHPPPLRGEPAAVFAAWIDFGRNFMELPDADIYWYGLNPRQYYVVIDGRGDYPPDGALLYDRDGIRIFKPREQAEP